VVGASEYPEGLSADYADVRGLNSATSGAGREAADPSESGSGEHESHPRITDSRSPGPLSLDARLRRAAGRPDHELVLWRSESTVEVRSSSVI
jgi:hypothetical protein